MENEIKLNFKRSKLYHFVGNEIILEMKLNCKKTIKLNNIISILPVGDLISFQFNFISSKRGVAR